MKLVLASSSKYRLTLLEQLGLDAVQIAPDADESPVDGEKPRDRALRLGHLKADSVVSSLELDGPWVLLASDQVCHMNGEIYRQPGNAEIAARHLARFSGNWVTFSTSLVLVHSDGRRFGHVEDFEIHFRTTTRPVIDAYIKADEPYDCAGALKVESLGITLLDDTRGRDINSVYGIPLMALEDALQELGYTISDFINTL